jgi:hypothetical protein
LCYSIEHEVFCLIRLSYMAGEPFSMGTIQHVQFDHWGDTGAFGEGSRCGAVCE